MRIITWNLEWAPPSSKRGQIIRDLLRELNPDVVCYTEVNLNMLPEGFTIEADPDHGYPHNGDRRKVVLWSKTPWEAADNLGDASMPSGRYATGITRGIRFVGVCIPWKDAHVRNGHKDRKAWQEHMLYLKGLEAQLAQFRASKAPLFVLGDYNQRIPAKYQPKEVAEMLLRSLTGLQLITEAALDYEGKQLIDHIAVSPELSVEVTRILPEKTSDGLNLSDHVGVVIDLSREAI